MLTSSALYNFLKKPKASSKDSKLLQDMGIVDDSFKRTAKGDALLAEYDNKVIEYGKKSVEFAIKNATGYPGYEYFVRTETGAMSKSQRSLKPSSQQAKPAEIPAQKIQTPAAQSDMGMKDYISKLKTTYPVITSITEEGNELVLGTKIKHSRDPSRFRQVASDVGMVLDGGKSVIYEGKEGDKGKPWTNSREFKLTAKNFDWIKMQTESTANQPPGKKISSFKEQPLKIVISQSHQDRGTVEKLLKSLSENFDYKGKEK
jgi:hypothetical protein